MKSLIRISSKSFATKLKAGGIKKIKDSAGRRLGIKKLGGQEVFAGDIIARQRGFKFKLGENVHRGKDHTIHATKEGKVLFTASPYDRRKHTTIHVVEQEIPNRIVCF